MNPAGGGAILDDVTAVVEDITFGEELGAVEAYLVRPAEAAARSAAGILFWHWLDSEAPDGNRTQFRAEAEALADRGVVALLPQGRFPWTIAPIGSEADHREVEAEVARLRAGLDLLVDRPEVDPERLAVVGHDYGAMHAIAEVAGDDRVKALVVIAATPRWSDWNLPFWGLKEDHLDYDRRMRDLDPIERMKDLAGRPILLQFGERDWFIAPMSGWAFRRAGGGEASVDLKTYDAEHDMRHPEARSDRAAFLSRTLGLAEG
jgi:dienelactone hydrolase